MGTTGTKKLMLAMLLAFFAIGCGEDGGNGGGLPIGSTDDPPFWLPPVNDAGPGLNPGLPQGNDWQFGGTGTMTASSSQLAFYTGWTPNNHTNLRVNLNLRQYGEGFGGVVTIGFEDNGRVYEDSFTSLVNEGHWYGDGRVTSNVVNNQYNIWFDKNGKRYWHGFFQDSFGAVIVVIDQNDDLGDGQGATNVGGSVWVMNFGRSYAPVSPTSCWFVSLGPYDCRTWKSGNGINSTQAIYPYLENNDPGTAYEPKAVGYKKIGNFSNMNYRKAFNL